MKKVNSINYELESLGLIYLKLFDNIDVFKDTMSTIDKKDVVYNKLENYEKFIKSFNFVIDEDILSLKPYFKNFIYQGPFIIDFHIHLVTYEGQNFKDALNAYFNNFYESIIDEYTPIKDFKDFIAATNKLEIEDDIKIHMINFYVDGESIYNKIINYARTLIDQIKLSISIIENDLLESIKKIETTNLASFGKNYKLEFFDDPELVIYPSIILPNQATLFKENNTTFSFVGYLLIEVIEAKERNQVDEAKIIEFLKLISDQTRYRILNYLKVKNMFVQELAKELKLTTPTLIHHMELLLNANLIDVYMNKEDKKRVFYKLNNERLQELLDMLKRNLI